jgi:AraC family transcriptional regulator of adaptative response/methylated-DNA-[protein]-cysteine methyltransferase
MQPSTHKATFARRTLNSRTARFATAEERWRAVQRRDVEADGVFYYAVRTTSVYCRPSCPARRPLRVNVSFHPSSEAARAAGFRACKRCRPEAADGLARNGAAVAHACRLIAQADEPLSVVELATAVGMSRFHFQRLFKATTGVTPKAYSAAERRRRLGVELTSGASVTDAFYAAGFKSSSRFYSEARRQLGMEPRQFKQGGREVAIRFAVGECSLGAILVAASTQGVCAILLGDEPAALVRDLQDRFPNADLQAGGEEFERSVARVVGFVDAPRTGLALPLDIRGTAFQQRVWQALLAVPAGATVTYAELAKRIGAPRAARAVAGACAANPLAVAIPCHRVVRTDGSLSGYRWGVERKRALLARESRR